MYKIKEFLFFFLTLFHALGCDKQRNFNRSFLNVTHWFFTQLNMT